MRSQFFTYADAITAFATAQAVGFILLMTHGDCFTRNVLGGLWYAVGMGAAANLCYLALVVLCHHAGAEVDKEPHVIGKIRYVIILADLAATALIPLAINYGLQQGNFFIDCKG